MFNIFVVFLSFYFWFHPRLQCRWMQIFRFAATQQTFNVAKVLAPTGAGSLNIPWQWSKFEKRKTCGEQIIMLISFSLKHSGYWVTHTYTHEHPHKQLEVIFTAAGANQAQIVFRVNQIHSPPRFKHPYISLPRKHTHTQRLRPGVRHWPFVLSGLTSTLTRLTA